jgi:predicted porin
MRESEPSVKCRFILLSLLAVSWTGVTSAQSGAAQEPAAGVTAPASAAATVDSKQTQEDEKKAIAAGETEARRISNDAALDQDPESARRFVKPFERRGDVAVKTDEPPLRLYGSVRVHAIKNGTEVSNDDQGSGFSLGDGGSRVGARIQQALGKGTSLFGRVEGGFNVLDVFSSNAGSREEDQGHALNPRLYYIGIDSPYVFASFGKNWSTYYKIAGMTDRFAVFGGNTSGVFNAGTDGGASGTGRADEVLQTRLYLDIFKGLRIKPFNLNVQYQRNQPIARVDDANFGDQFGASAWFDTEAGWGFGVAYNLSRIEDRSAPAIVAAGIDGNDQALAVSTRWSGDHWYASLVWSRQDNHAINDQDLYVDGNGAEIYAQWEFRDRWWLVAGGNWFKADDRDSQAGLYEVDKKIIGLRRTIDSFNRMFYLEYQLNDGSSFAGETSENESTVGVRWDFGYGKHKPLEILDPLLKKAEEL